MAAKKVKKISKVFRYCFNSCSPCQVGGGIKPKISSGLENGTYKEAVPQKLVTENQVNFFFANAFFLIVVVMHFFSGKLKNKNKKNEKKRKKLLK